MALGGVAAAGCSPGRTDDNPAMVVGVPDGAGTGTSGPKVITSAPEEEPPPPGGAHSDVFVDPAPFGGGGAEPSASSALAAANGKPWGPAIPFTTNQTVPDGLVFVLVAGSDARPGEDLLKTRADSLHLLCVNPETGQGTLLGFPRDSWVEIPGHGRGKINNALALGGPNLLSKTVQRLTGLPIDYYVITGFKGLMSMVDELGGVDVHVDRRMNDKNSGARFQRGWHHMTGGQALAFSRNRTDVEQGDLSRSEHQGEVMLAALAKMRSEVADDAGVARWISVLVKHTKLDVPLAKLPQLGALARRLDPSRLKNVVAPGRLGFASRQSVVFLTQDAATMFEDLRPDAVLGTAQVAPSSASSPSSSSSSSTTSTGRTAKAPRTSTSTSPSTSTSSSSRSTTDTTPPSESTTSTTEDPDSPFPILPDEPPEEE